MTLSEGLLFTGAPYKPGWHASCQSTSRLCAITDFSKKHDGRRRPFGVVLNRKFAHRLYYLFRRHQPDEQRTHLSASDACVGPRQQDAHSAGRHAGRHDGHAILCDVRGLDFSLS